MQAAPQTQQDAAVASRSDTGDDYTVVVPYALPVDVGTQLLHQEQYHMVLGLSMQREMHVRDVAHHLLLHAAALSELLQSHEDAMAEGVQTPGAAAERADAFINGAAGILCRIHIVVQTARALMAAGVSSAALPRVLSVAERGMRMCGKQFSEASVLVADTEGAEGVAAGAGAAAAGGGGGNTVGGSNRSGSSNLSQQEKIDRFLGDRIIAQLLMVQAEQEQQQERQWAAGDQAHAQQGGVVPEAQQVQDEELQDTGSSVPAPARMAHTV